MSHFALTPSSQRAIRCCNSFSGSPADSLQRVGVEREMGRTRVGSHRWVTTGLVLHYPSSLGSETHARAPHACMASQELSIWR